MSNNELITLSKWNALQLERHMIHDQKTDAGRQMARIREYHRETGTTERFESRRLLEVHREYLTSELSRIDYELADLPAMPHT
jgi:hypothetical protein